MIYEIILIALYYTMYNHKTLISIAKSKLLYRSKFQELCSLRCWLYNLIQYCGIAPILYLSHVLFCIQSSRGFLLVLFRQKPLLLLQPLLPPVTVSLNSTDSSRYQIATQVFLREVSSLTALQRHG